MLISREQGRLLIANNVLGPRRSPKSQDDQIFSQNIAHNFAQFAFFDDSRDPKTNKDNTHYGCVMTRVSTASHADTLETLGFNVTTIRFLVGHGFNTSVAMTTVTYKELQNFLKHYKPKETNSSIPAPQDTDDESDGEQAEPMNDDPDAQEAAAARPRRRPSPPLIFAFVTVTQFCAYHQWCYYKMSRGETPDAAAFQWPATMKTWVSRVSQYSAFASAHEPEKPPKLKDLDGWFEWEDLLVSYLLELRSENLWCPMAYLLRKEKKPIESVREAHYDSVDDDLICTLVHEGEHFRLDNKWFYSLLETLTTGGPGEAFVRMHVRKRDGNAAYFQLKSQAEGSSAIATLRNKCMTILDTAVFTGKGNYLISQHVSKHVTCHSRMARTDAPLIESTKVDKFVKSLQDPRLQTCKEIIAGDTEKLNDFTLTQQFVCTSLANQKAQTTTTRKVSRVNQESKKHSKTAKRNPKKGSKRKVEEVDDMEELDPNKRYNNRTYDGWCAAKKARLHKLRAESEGRQVSAVSFAPSPEALEKAQKIIAAYEKANKQQTKSVESKQEDSSKKDAGKQFGSGSHSRNSKG